MFAGPERVDPDWVNYPNTVLHFGAQGSRERIDLREPVGGEVMRVLTSLDLARPFVVMTAHDPLGEDADDRANATRQLALEREITAAGARFYRVDACSPDGAHCESSVAVVMERDAALGIARRFGQAAVFWFDGERFWIVGAAVESDPVMLPRAF